MDLDLEGVEGRLNMTNTLCKILKDLIKIGNKKINIYIVQLSP